MDRVRILGQALGLALASSSCAVVYIDGAGAGGAGASSTSSVTSSTTASTAVATGSTDASSTTSGTPADRDIRDQLAALPGVSAVEEMDAPIYGYRAFSLLFDQPEDHDDPSGTHFQQRIQILHTDVTAPMVLFTSGYAIFETPSYPSEPTTLLGANQVEVEQRFFLPSRAANPDWTKLTIAQAAADHHAIVQAFKAIYDKKWISTGGSKGGMTSIYHRRFFPDDVDGTVAYVAPNMLSQGDERFDSFLANEPAACSAAIKAMANEALVRRVAMGTRTAAAASSQGLSLARVGVDRAVEDAASSLLWTFWQYYGVTYCSSVPTDPKHLSDDDVYGFLTQFSPPISDTDDQLLQFEPFYWQEGWELGSPASESSIDPSLLKYATDDVSPYFPTAPFADDVFHPGVMQSIQDWVASQGDKLLFVYGERDPWSAGAFSLGMAQRSFTFTFKDGTHESQISDLPTSQQQTATSALGSWAGVAIQQRSRPPVKRPARHLPPVRFRRHALTPSAAPRSSAPSPR